MVGGGDLTREHVQWIAPADGIERRSRKVLRVELSGEEPKACGWRIALAFLSAFDTCLKRRNPIALAAERNLAARRLERACDLAVLFADLLLLLC